MKNHIQIEFLLMHEHMAVCKQRTTSTFHQLFAYIYKGYIYTACRYIILCFYSLKKKKWKSLFD